MFSTKKCGYNISIWVLFCLVCLAQIPAIGKETNKAHDTSILEQLRKVEQSDWQAKSKVLKDILPQESKLSSIEKDKLIEIFEKESKFQEEYVDKLRKQGVPINEAIDKFHKEYRQKGYADYFLSFARLIFSLKNTKAIPSLLRALYYYGGAIGPPIIIDFGEDAIAPLLDCLNSKDRSVRNTSYAVLSVWVNAPVKAEDYTITGDMTIKDIAKLSEIKAIFLKASKDENKSVRSAAVYGLGAFPDENVVRSLEEVAKHDPYSFYSKYEKRTKYPIREEALKTIEKIKNKMKSKTESK